MKNKKAPKKTAKKIAERTPEVIDIHNLPARVVARMCGVTESSVAQWDCPRNKNKKIDLFDFYKWRESKLREQITPTEKVDLEKEKLKLQCEKMTIEITEMKEKNISVETHQQILCGRAESLKRYWTESFQRNLHLMCHKGIEQLRPLAERFIREACNAYARSHADAG